MRQYDRESVSGYVKTPVLTNLIGMQVPLRKRYVVPGRQVGYRYFQMRFIPSAEAFFIIF